MLTPEKGDEAVWGSTLLGFRAWCVFGASGFSGFRTLSTETPQVVGFVFWVGFWGWVSWLSDASWGLDVLSEPILSPFWSFGFRLQGVGQESLKVVKLKV